MQNLKTILKFVILIVFTTSLIYLRSFPYVLFSFFLVLVVAAKVNKNDLKNRFKPLIFIGLLVIGFNLVFNRSLPTDLRLKSGILHSLRIIALSFSVFIFTATTSINDLLTFLFFLPPSLRLLLTITFGIIPSLFDEARKIGMIQHSRGWKINSWRIYRNFLPFLVPLLYRTLERSEQLTISIISRGWGRFSFKHGISKNML